ncbi:MAG: aspartate/glutamate racemase family protein [Deltaproteobacteria bacterium]|nr:aspartate/glutamate racemase family protein [Deltaproteobacteria bacterium]
MNALNPPSEESFIPVIGVFDSGIGGLFPLRAIRGMLPALDLLFLADTARGPYGQRSMNTVARFAREGIRHLIDSKADLLVIACPAAATAWIQEKIRPCAVPVIDGVTAAAAAAVSVSKTHCFGVLGNRAAVESGVYERLIRERLPDARIYARSSRLLDVLVEEGWAKRPETARIAKKLVHPLKARQIDTLILGSPFLSVIEAKIAAKAGKKVKIVNSDMTLAGAVNTAIKNNPDLARPPEKTGGVTIRVTDNPAGLKEKCEKWFRSRVRLEVVSLSPEKKDGDSGMRD